MMQGTYCITPECLKITLKITQGRANFLWKEPDGKYIRLYELDGVCMMAQLCSSSKGDKGVWPCAGDSGQPLPLNYNVPTIICVRGSCHLELSNSHV